eukprot:355903-Chlamydomonas_euryale.AAC.7
MPGFRQLRHIVTPYASYTTPLDELGPQPWQGAQTHFEKWEGKGAALQTLAIKAVRTASCTPSPGHGACPPCLPTTPAHPLMESFVKALTARQLCQSSHSQTALSKPSQPDSFVKALTARQLCQSSHSQTTLSKLSQPEGQSDIQRGPHALGPCCPHPALPRPMPPSTSPRLPSSLPTSLPPSSLARKCLMGFHMMNEEVFSTRSPTHAAAAAHTH